MNIYKIAIVTTAITLCGCATSQPAMPQNTGAVKHNIAAQAITPPAAQKADRNIPQDRALRDAARKRYREDKVKVPNRTGTQNSPG